MFPSAVCPHLLNSDSGSPGKQDLYDIGGYCTEQTQLCCAVFGYSRRMLFFQIIPLCLYLRVWGCLVVVSLRFLARTRALFFTKLLQFWAVVSFPDSIDVKCIDLFLSRGRSRETRGGCSLGPVSSVLRSGLWTAVPRLSRKQKISARHQETVGEVSHTCPSFSLCAIAPSANSLELCILHAGFDAVSPAVRLRSTTQNWAISKEEASDPQPVPDWPDQQTLGNAPTLLLQPLKCPLSPRFSPSTVFGSCPFASLFQKPEDSFWEVERGAGVWVAGGNRTWPVRHHRSPLGRQRSDPTVSHSPGSGAGILLWNDAFDASVPPSSQCVPPVSSPLPSVLLFGI